MVVVVVVVVWLIVVVAVASVVVVVVGLVVVVVGRLRWVGVVAVAAVAASQWAKAGAASPSRNGWDCAFFYLGVSTEPKWLRSLALHFEA